MAPSPPSEDDEDEATALERGLIDIAGDELVGNLVAVRFRVVIDTSFQFPEYSLHGSSRERGHVVRFHPAVLVQAGHKGLRSVVGVRDLIGIEGHGTLEDVGLRALPSM